MHAEVICSAETALRKLKEGNLRYLNETKGTGDISPEKRCDVLANGQHPFAVIVTCSDSRVVPEYVFSADLGDLFVIRVAGNVIDDHQLGSIEYATEHLGIRLVVVLGHDHCGAVDAAINHDPDGYIKFITDEIKLAIGDETDDYCVHRSVFRSGTCEADGKRAGGCLRLRSVCRRSPRQPDAVY